MANFEIAVREKYRFPFKGSITAEDLWDLSPEQLNSVYKARSKEKKNSDEESLLDTRRSKDEEALANRIEIVKYIFDVKQAEIQAKREEAKRYAQKQKIMSIIADKEDQALKSLSVEDLKKLLEE